MSLIFRTVVKCIVIIFYIISLYFFARGHNAPGGGFIAGLLVIMATFLLIFSNLFNLSLRTAIIWGVLGMLSLFICLVFPLIFQQAPLAAGWWEVGNLFFGTPLLFDFGVYSIAIGGGLLLIKIISQDS